MFAKSFTYNVVFEPEAVQEDVFMHSGMQQLIDLAMEGYSTTCICYGQTGSGKTHTLSGPPQLVTITLSMSYIVIVTHVRFQVQKSGTNLRDVNHGLMVRAFTHLFELINNRHHDYYYRVKASYLEIYNEKVKQKLVVLIDF